MNPEHHKHTLKFEGKEEAYLDSFLGELEKEDSELRNDLMDPKDKTVDDILAGYGIAFEPPLAETLDGRSLQLPDAKDVRAFRQRLKKEYGAALGPDKTHSLLLWRAISAGG